MNRQSLIWILAIALLVGNIFFWYRTWLQSQTIQSHLDAIVNASPSDLNEAEFEAAYRNLQQSEQRALAYLSFFEVMGVGLAVVGVLGTGVAVVLGGGVREAQEKFRESEVHYKESSDKLQANISLYEERYKALNDELRKQIEVSIQNASVAELLISMARQQYELGYLPAAKEIYLRAQRLAPTTPVIPYRLAYILTQLEDLDEAENILKDALAADPEFPNALASLGFVYRRKGDKTEHDEALRYEYYKKAEKYLTDALNLNPYLMDDDGESWHGALAGLYRRMERNKDAIHHYSRAAYYTPQSSYPKLNLLILQWQHNETDKLRQQLEEVERLLFVKVKKDKDTYWDRADILNIELALGKPSAEIDDNLKTFLQVLPRDAKDVLPRVIATTEFILDAPDFPGDKRDKTKIAAVLEQLRAEQEKHNKEV